MVYIGVIYGLYGDNDDPKYTMKQYFLRYKALGVTQGSVVSKP